MGKESPLGTLSSDSIWNAIRTKASFNSWRNSIKRQSYAVEMKKYEVKPTSVYHVITAYWGSGISHCCIYVFLERRDFLDKFELIATFHKMGYQNIESSLEAGNILKFVGVFLRNLPERADRRDPIGGSKEVVLTLRL